MTVQSRTLNPVVKFGLDFAPLLVFMGVNIRFGLIPASLALVVASAISMLVIWIYTRHLSLMLLLTSVMAIVFGGLTFYFQDERFIKFKPTILNLIMGSVLIGSWLLKKPILPLLLNSVMTLPQQAWQRLTLRWGLFFLALAALNEVIWRTQSTDVWVNFKVFGIMTLTFLFSLTQLSSFIPHQQDATQAGVHK